MTNPSSKRTSRKNTPSPAPSQTTPHAPACPVATPETAEPSSQSSSSVNPNPSSQAENPASPPSETSPSLLTDSDLKRSLLTEMRAIMEGVIDDRLAALQQSLMESLSQQFQVQFDKKLADARTEIEVELSDRFDNKIRNLEEKIAELTKNQNTVKLKMKSNFNHLGNMDAALESQEQRTRKYNLRILNLPFTNKKETDESLLTLLQSKLTPLGIEITSSDVAHIHRMGPAKTSKAGVLWKPVLVRFTNWSARLRCLQVNKKAGKKNPLRAFHDLTDVRFKLLKQAREEIAESYRELGYSGDKISKLNDKELMFAFATPSCETRVRCCGTVHSFSTMDELKNVIANNFYKEHAPESDPDLYASASDAPSDEE